MSKKYLKYILLFLILQIHIIWSAFIPPFQGNDEEKHLSTILFFKEEKRLISKEDQGLGFRESDWYKNLKESIIETEAHRIFANTNYHQDFDNEKDLSAEVEEINVSPGYPYQPGYYIVSAVVSLPFNDVLSTLYVSRIISVIFSLLTWWFVYKIILIITRNDKVSLLGMAFIGLFPIFSYSGSMVNNDAFLGFVSTLSIFGLLKLREEISPRNLLVLSFALALGLLSKPQYAFIALPISIFAVYFILKSDKNKYLERFLQLLIFPIILALPWFIYNLSEFGRLFPDVHNPNVGIVGGLPRSENTAYAGRNLIYYIPSVFQRWFVLLPARFAGDFGQVDTQVPSWLYTVFRLLLLSIFLFIIYRLFSLIKRGRVKYYHFIFISIFIFIEGFYTYLWIRGYYRKGFSSFPLFARYYFPIVAIGAYTLVSFLVFLKQRFRINLFNILLAMVLIYNLYCISLVVVRYYL